MAETQSDPFMRATPIVHEMKADLIPRLEAITEEGVQPRLVIIADNLDSPIGEYVNHKKLVGNDVLGIHTVVQSGLRADSLPTYETLPSYLHQAAADPHTNAVILQLPIKAHRDLGYATRGVRDRQLLNIIPAEKDVDGLALDTNFTPATPLGIMRMIAHYVPEFKELNTVLYGYGRLVNGPLDKLLQDKGVNATCIDDKNSTADKEEILHDADLIIAATGVARSLTLGLVGKDKSKAIIDAGTSEQDGIRAGDMSDELREYAKSTPGWRLTPKSGGVGPLTVWGLFTNVVEATEKQIDAGTAARAWGSELLSSPSYREH